jgi:hypothetical protein
MKELRKKAVEFVSGAWGEIEYGLKCLCGRPSPMKRFIAVLTVGGVLAVANIYFIANSIYNMGKRDAERQFLELKIGGSQLQHIEPVELPLSKDSIHSNKNFKWKKSKINKL